MRILPRRIAPGVLCAALAAAPLTAQAPVYTWYGDTSYDGLGRSVSELGHLDGDGKAETLAGAPWDNFIAQDGGMVRIFNGNGTVRFSIYGNSQFDEFGYAVADVGDVDGDGRPDFVVGVYREDNGANGSGSAICYTSSVYLPLWTADGAGQKDFLGISVDGVGDVNGDGIPDVIAGAWEYDPGINPGTGKGYARVYHGRTGALIHEVFGDDNEDFFGYSVAGVGDVNGDGAGDFAVGAYGDELGFGPRTGSVRVFSGATGLALYTITGDSAGDQFGIRVAPAGDVNGDGFPDIVIGADQDVNPSGIKAGSVRVVSGPTGATIWTAYGANANDQFGLACDGIGDIDGDGHDEILVGIRGDDTRGDNAGAAQGFDGATGALLFTVYGDTDHDVFGFAVSAAGDVTGDGVPDFMVGASQYNAGPGPGNGFVRVFDPTLPPPPPPPPWPELPTSFVMVGAQYSQDFEAVAGQPPSSFGINELHGLSRQYDPQAWCNVGQRGACTAGALGILPHNGNFDLELGGAPGGTSGFLNASGLILGLDGTGGGNLTLDYWGYNLGEEADPDDGVWVSEDGATWVKVQDGWSSLPAGAWSQVTGVQLSNAGVSTDGPFYLLFGQRDNNPIDAGDGVLIDEIVVRGSGGGLTLLGPSPGTAGTTNQLGVQGATLGAVVGWAYGLAAGQTQVPGCPGVFVSMANATVLGTARAGPGGQAQISFFVPSGASGRTVRFQAAEPSTCRVSNLVVHLFP